MTTLEIGKGEGVAEERTLKRESERSELPGRKESEPTVTSFSGFSRLRCQRNSSIFTTWSGVGIWNSGLDWNTRLGARRYYSVNTGLDSQIDFPNLIQNHIF